MQRIKTMHHFFFLISFLLLADFSFGQISQKGLPYSFSESFLEEHGHLEIPEVTVPLFDQKTLKKTQAAHPEVVLDGAGTDTRINMQTHGEWIILEGGSRLWRLKITVKGAAGLTLLYDHFWLPKGSDLYLYTADESQILGAFTARNNKKSGKFSTAETQDSSVVLEYYEPALTSEIPKISIHKVIQRFSKGRSRGEFGFNASSSCHININCTPGKDYQKEKRGVVRILMFLDSEEGTFLGYCSGSLLNNTSLDQTPYLLTAFHCIVEGFSPLYDQWQFDFGYETDACENPEAEPQRRFVVGAEQIAGRQDPDFLLLKISTEIPSSFQPYFNGWNRAMEALPQNSRMIHHPCGDVKKITADNNNTATIHPRTVNWAEYSSAPNTHFEIKFDEGFSQVGASGSPVFGADGLLYGQLHGGNINLASCEILRLYYGRLATSWDSDSAQTRLKDWLDPLNTGITSLEGLDPFVNTASFTGSLRTPNGEGIAGVSILIEGDETNTEIITDQNGNFNIDLPRTSDYRLTFSKFGDPLNGVTTFDIVKIRRHILGLEPFDDVFKQVAADTNISGSVTTFDMIEIQKLILGINTSFPNAPSWGFVSPEGRLFNILTLDDIQEVVNLNILGIKMGDVNYSANPEE